MFYLPSTLRAVKRGSLNVRRSINRHQPCELDPVLIAHRAQELSHFHEPVDASLRLSQLFGIEPKLFDLGSNALPLSYNFLPSIRRARPVGPLPFGQQNATRLVSQLLSQSKRYAKSSAGLSLPAVPFSTAVKNLANTPRTSQLPFVLIMSMFA